MMRLRYFIGGLKQYETLLEYNDVYMAVLQFQTPMHACIRSHLLLTIYYTLHTSPHIRISPFVIMIDLQKSPPIDRSIHAKRILLPRVNPELDYVLHKS